MSNAYIQYGFRDYPCRNSAGEKGYLHGVAKIRLRPNPDYADNWTVDGFHVPSLPETGWQVKDLDRWLHSKPEHRREIDALVKAAEEAAGQ